MELPDMAEYLEGNVLPPSPSFWIYLEQLVANCSLVIDRPRNSFHPCYPEIVYPLDYGYLEGSSAIDGKGVDVWLGSIGTHNLCSVILTVDLNKRDAEIKILLGCTEAEIQTILEFHTSNSIQALLVRRTIKMTEQHE